MPGYGFATNEDAERVISGVLNAEIMARSALEGLIPQGPESGHVAVFVRVTSASKDNYGYYPGVTMYPDVDPATSEVTWTDVPKDCPGMVIEVNGAGLVPNKRYFGYACEAYSGKSIIVVLGEVHSNTSPGDCPVWYTGYHHLSGATVSVGEVVHPGGVVGYLKVYDGGAHSHFSLGDGSVFLSTAAGSICGQTLDIESWLPWPIAGTRNGSVPGPAYYPPNFGPGDHAAHVAYIKSVFAPWVFGGSYVQYFGSAAHYAYEYYSVDVLPADPTLWSGQSMAGTPIRVAIRPGADVRSTVSHVRYSDSLTGWIVIVKHERLSCLSQTVLQSGSGMGSGGSGSGSRGSGGTPNPGTGCRGTRTYVSDVGCTPGGVGTRVTYTVEDKATCDIISTYFVDRGCCGCGGGGGIGSGSGIGSGIGSGAGSSSGSGGSGSSAMTCAICPDTSLPATVNASVSGAVAPCACANGLSLPAMTRSGSAGSYSWSTGSFLTCGSEPINNQITIQCDSLTGLWRLNFITGPGTCTGIGVSYTATGTCSPLAMTFVVAACMLCNDATAGQTATVTITI